VRATVSDVVSPSYFLVPAAVELGFFREEGLDVEFVHPPEDASAALRDTPSACPGYLAHLRSARACLARGDRRAAAAELRQAEQALDSCIRGAAGHRAVAGLEPAPRAS